jgi:hypothetical protein
MLKTIVYILISELSVIYKSWIMEQTVGAVRLSVNTHVLCFLMCNIWNIVREPLPAVNGLMELVSSRRHVMILPVVLYGCETWLLTLREECRLRFSSIVCRGYLGLRWKR